MSKLNSELLTSSIDNIVAYSAVETITNKGEEVKGKLRKFVESVELQVTLKNYDPSR
jgi:ribosomal protein L1